MVNWLQETCLIPFQAIRILCQNFEKERFYTLTREAFIRETTQDWGKGHGVPDAQLADAKVKLCKKYRITNFNLDSMRSISMLICLLNSIGTPLKDL